MFSPLFYLVALLPSVAVAHISLFHPSMWGFNVSLSTFSYDNRPFTPLYKYTFDQWWFHGLLDYPPPPNTYFQLEAGKPNNAELACNKAYSTWGKPKSAVLGDDPCPGATSYEYHAMNFTDIRGCALAITYQSDVTQVQPEDFAVFSVNQSCVWYRNTAFQVPASMPPCPPGGCLCAWFWTHSQYAGSEQNYMTGFRCNITGSTSNVPIAKSKIPRRCGAYPIQNKLYPEPSNCTYGAKQPFYWLQAERNNMFESPRTPPFYNDLYNFLDGPQDDIFEDSVLPTFASYSTGWPSTKTTAQPKSTKRDYVPRGAMRP